MTSVDRLVEEFRVAYVAGERPDAGEFLLRAPEADRDEVGRRIRRVLADTPPPGPAPETLLMVRAMLAGQPPLLELRSSRGLTRAQVVTRLREELDIAPVKEERVAVYYHELETGQLPLAGIRDRVFDALAVVMGVARASLMLTGPDPSVPGAPHAVYARGRLTPDAEALGGVSADAGLPTPDEVDDLFTGGPG